MKSKISSRVLVLGIVIFGISFARTVWAQLDQTAVPPRILVSAERFD